MSFHIGDLSKHMIRRLGVFGKRGRRGAEKNGVVHAISKGFGRHLGEKK